MQLKGRIEHPGGEAVDCVIHVEPASAGTFEGRAQIPEDLLEEFGEHPNSFRFRTEDGDEPEQFASPLYMGVPMTCAAGALVVRLGPEEADGQIRMDL